MVSRYLCTQMEYIFVRFHQTYIILFLVVTVVPKIPLLTVWYGIERLIINCSTVFKNITIQITVQKTVGAIYSIATSTFWSGTMSPSYIDSGIQIIYTWTTISGQSVNCSGAPYNVEAQFILNQT